MKRRNSNALQPADGEGNPMTLEFHISLTLEIWRIVRVPRDWEDDE
ncbi:hypothetical protein IAG41_09755 [Sphingomonas sp. JC676]|nr:hypothetical protein [Sphingomonas sp. JC676]MBC9032676.1 hypothetical protein [Sphingomonas sp. JC676]